MIPLWQSNPGNIIASLSPAAWYRFGQGITVATGVSQWSDASSNARHLLQATGAAQPTLQADGSILFNGTSQFLKAGAFTFPQPITAYLLMKQVSWTINMNFLDGQDAATLRLNLFQSTATPGIGFFDGSTLGPDNTLAVGSYGVISIVANGASSFLGVNNGAGTSGNAGANSAGGLTLGARGDAASFGNIQVKEVIAFGAAHNATTRATVIGYLMRLGGL